MNRPSATPAARPVHRQRPAPAAPRATQPAAINAALAPTLVGNADQDEDEDEEDDYMSAAFLADPAPASSSSSSSASSAATYSQRRKLALQAQSRPPPGSTQSILDKRNEGLKRKIDESNKGMSLLQKMGWKEGAALGKTNPGILEPLAPTLHRGRLGIGLKSVQDEQEEKEAKRIRLLQGKEDEFRDWRATKFAERLIEGDIRKARKICFQLDSAKEITSFSHFWPLSLQPPPPTDNVFDPIDSFALASAPNPDEIELTMDDDNTDGESTSASDQSDNYGPSLADAPLRPLEPLPDLASLDKAAPTPEPAPEATDPDEIEPWTAEAKAFEALEPSEQLAQLISTLRERYTYCLYCGCTFTSDQEMDEVCPGPSRDEH